MIPARSSQLRTSVTIAEAGWLVRRQLGTTAEVAIYRAAASGELRVEPLTASDWARVAELCDTYSDIGLDAADASLVALAERLDLSTIATLDERDFRIIRPSHINAFDLVPGPS